MTFEHAQQGREPTERPPLTWSALQPALDPRYRTYAMKAGSVPHGRNETIRKLVHKFDFKPKNLGYSVRMRTAYKCRAYPDEAQQAMLSRTFGCVRVVWNRTLAARHARWHAEGKGTGYAETDRALTAMKRDPDLEFLNEVSAVPLQQALRHQQAAFTAFWEKRARYQGLSPGTPASRPPTPGRRSA